MVIVQVDRETASILKGHIMAGKRGQRCEERDRRMAARGE